MGVENPLDRCLRLVLERCRSIAVIRINFRPPVSASPCFTTPNVPPTWYVKSLFPACWPPLLEEVFPVSDCRHHSSSVPGPLFLLSFANINQLRYNFVFLPAPACLCLDIFRLQGCALFCNKFCALNVESSRSVWRPRVNVFEL